MRATHRAKKNFVEGLNDTRRNWITEEKGICDVTKEYFEDLFLTSSSTGYDRIDGVISHYVTSKMNDGLEEKVIEKEVLEAFGQMDLRKALDINVLSSLF